MFGGSSAAPLSSYESWLAAAARLRVSIAVNHKQGHVCLDKVCPHVQDAAGVKEVESETNECKETADDTHREYIFISA